MGKMKQLWFVEEGKVALLDVDIPEIKGNQVKVKIAYAAICATDVHQVTMGVLGAVPPMALGHEASGIIVEVSLEAAGAGFREGDQVALFPVTNCASCAWCKKGMPQYCINARTTGAFAEYVVVDISAVFKVPEGSDLKKYALAEPTNCTLRAMDLVPIKHGSTVAIAGIGGIGSIMLNQILLSGAARITAIDPVSEKRELALAMGAKHVIDPFHEDVVKRSMEITDGVGFDYVFEVSGSPKAAETPLKILARCGTAVYFAVFPPKFEIPLNLYDLYMKEGKIQTVFNVPNTMHRSINIIERMQTDKIIGKIMPLRDAVKSFEVFHQSIYPKILLDCSKT
ncbi:MAG: alcohol dehydrogenase catalytic domain-containing protein [Synergistaceae bacterium]|jgi:threonine dehydrogenase-like Zn-dependent dehydrogenase|nr:alcohol dehydrogenase catalytic domain-containing protein [Synergistaceae bacterium]